MINWPGRLHSLDWRTCEKVWCSKVHGWVGATYKLLYVDLLPPYKERREKLTRVYAFLAEHFVFSVAPNSGPAIYTQLFKKPHGKC